jgi:hypothetical protein
MFGTAVSVYKMNIETLRTRDLVELKAAVLGISYSSAGNDRPVELKAAVLGFRIPLLVMTDL